MSSVTEELPQELRLYIGAISPELYAEKDQLTSRLSKFGKLLSELDIHQKPTSLTYFAYINIEITPKELVKLKQHLNGVNFKNSKLIIDVLRKTFDKVWEEDHNRPDKKEEDRLKREKIALRRQERILHGKDELVIKGRIRKTPRKNLKNLTLRCYLNGKPISFKNNKTKVWGYDKNKKLRDLTWVFEKNAWKDGNFHIKETVSSKQISVIALSDGEEEEVFEIEKETNNKILSSLFENFDFDKPVEFKEADNEEESGESDYEFELSFNRTDNYDVKLKDYDQSYKVIEEYKKSNPLPSSPKLHQEDTNVASDTGYMSNSDEGEEVQDSVVEDINNDIIEEVQDSVVEDINNDIIVEEAEDQGKHSQEENSDIDEEFIPVFGKQIEPSEVNDTEKLRDLFNPTETSSFKLQDSDIDDDGSNNVEVEAEEILQQQLEKKQILSTVTHKALFFAHEDSPFLHTQSQLTKISKEFNKTEYETWFYEKRGELNREFKRYKRDFVRQLNKKKK